LVVYAGFGRKLPLLVYGSGVQRSGTINLGAPEEKDTIYRDSDCRDTEAGRCRAESEGPAPEHGIREATYNNWKLKYCGTEAAEVKRRKGLEVKNVKLKWRYADLAVGY
jgi:hypothetical protein